MSKKNYLFVAAVAIFMVALGSFQFFGVSYPDMFIAQPGQETPLNVNYKFNANTEHLPKTVNVYKVVKNQANETTVRQLGEKFGLEGTIELNNTLNQYILSDENHILKVDKSNKNYFSYMDLEVAYNLDINKSIVDDHTAKKAAETFLKERDLLPERFNNIKVVPQTSGSELENNLKVVAKDVWFYPTIDNKQVYGISRIIVTIGDNGSIEAVNNYYHDFELFKQEPIKTVQTAFEEMKQGKASNNIAPEAKEAIITSVHMGYWEDPDQVYIQPVYVFVGETEIEGQNHSFDAVVPALEDVDLKGTPDGSEVVESKGPKVR